MIAPDHDDRSDNGNEHTVKIEARNACRAEGRKQISPNHCAHDPENNVEEQALQ